jgi:hypothetical protein
MATSSTGNATKNYVLKSPVKHNGKLYKAAATIQLTERQAAHLARAKAIGLPAAAK